MRVPDLFSASRGAGAGVVESRMGLSRMWPTSGGMRVRTPTTKISERGMILRRDLTNSIYLR